MRTIILLPGVRATTSNRCVVTLDLAEFLDCHGLDPSPEEQQWVLQGILDHLDSYPLGIRFGLAEVSGGTEGGGG